VFRAAIADASIALYGDYIFQCSEPAGATLAVVLSQDGRVAEAKFQGVSYILAYKRTDWFIDIYVNSEMELRIDPEALLLRNGERIAGPCR